MSDIQPNESNKESMWALMEALFPMYRSLLGPGFHQSLKKIQEYLPLRIEEFPSGSDVFDWKIPKEFRVNESFVIDPEGQRIMDFQDCHYHLMVYSQPFHGEMDLEELLTHVHTHHILPDAVPLKVTYYREKWALCASQNQVKNLKPGRYQVHIDTELFDGALRIGEYYLPGETDEEILITSYLCHPHGANDNLSGVVVATELFRMLAQLPKRHYSYRLAIWPETIGSITYIYHHQERLKKTIGGYVLLCLGDDDSGLFHFNHTCQKDSLFDRAVVHALDELGFKYKEMPGPGLYSDERQFNGCGLRMPFGNLMRTPPGLFNPYHTSADNLDYVKPEILLQSLQVYWKILMTLERAHYYKGTYSVEPFLTRYGIYPFDLGAGEAKLGDDAESEKRVLAFYHLMNNADGRMDLLTIAQEGQIPLEYFDRPVSEFLEAGLIERVQQES